MGVKRAVDQALELSNDKSSATYTLGPLIHNKQTIEMLNLRGVDALDEKDLPNLPSTILIRAHGVPPQVMNHYKTAGYKIVDGTCPKVKTVHKVIEKYRDQGFKIVITGDEGHAEVIGLMGYADDCGHLIQTLDDVEMLPQFEKICLVSQTTFDRYLFDTIADKIKEKFSGSEIVVKKTICSATDQRQEETMQLAQSVDALIVVGGKNSANTQRLAKIAQECGAISQAVETENDIEWDLLAKCKTVGVTAGASTPNWMIKRVCDHLQFMSQTKSKSFSNSIMRLFDIIVNLNLFVATGAAGAYYVSCVLQNIPFTVSGAGITLFYFISVYLWNSLANRENTLHHDISKYRFYNKYPRTLLFMSGASTLTLLIGTFLINRPAFYLMLFASIAGFAYHVTIIPEKLQKLFPYKSMKDIPSSRDLFVALAWATILTFLPQTIQQGTLIIDPASIATFSLIFILSFLRSLIFDLRDIEGDRIMGRETLITIIGEKLARKAIFLIIWTCIALLLISPMVLGLTAHSHTKTMRFMFLVPVLFYAAVFVRFNVKISSNHSALFSLLADGFFYLAALGAFISTILINK